MSAPDSHNSPDVNLIADPWEWPCYGPLSSAIRRRKYQAFKFRLHGSLLWHREVQVLDTFPLFNPDFEQYFNEQGTDSTSEAAFIGLMGPSDEGGLRIALRTNPNSSETFDKLQDVDSRHVHGNGKFIWYPDGVPSPGFAKKLDSYLGLPNTSYNTNYIMVDHCDQMRQAFLAAFHRTRTVAYIYDQFSDVREELSSGWFEEFQKLIENQWRRSKIYEFLGYGLDGRGPLKPHRLAESLQPALRNRLRQLADASYHMAIHTDLDISSRFPGDRPPMALLPLFQHVNTRVVADDDATDADFANLTLMDKSAGLACLEGNVTLLLQSVRDLPVDRIHNLRGRKTFREYRSLYAEFCRKGLAADSTLLSEITRQVRECMKEIGKESGVKIEDSRVRRAFVALARFPLTTSAIAIGLILVTKQPLAGLAKPGLDYLFSIASTTQPIGTNRNPIRFRIKEAGSIKMLSSPF